MPACGLQVITAITSEVIANHSLNRHNQCMAKISEVSESSSAVGELLRAWRQARKLSQLELSLQSDVSQRHISFLESGRSRPSQSMLALLADALELPFRERNVLFDAAGYAGIYTEQSLHEAAMQPVREALQMQLEHHNPYPALVVDRDWNMLLANTALIHLFAQIDDAAEMWAATNPDSQNNGKQNLMRLTLHPQGLRKYCVNWAELAPQLLQRLRREVKLTNSPAMQALLTELQADPELDEYWHQPIVNISPQPVYAMTLAFGDVIISLFSMISTFGTPQDVTTDELRVELFFPIDDSSKQWLLAK